LTFFKDDFKLFADAISAMLTNMSSPLAKNAIVMEHTSFVCAIELVAAVAADLVVLFRWF